MKTLKIILDKVLEVLCCTLLVLMTIFATWQVLSRYIFSKPSTYTEELLLISFVWMGLLGAAYVFGKQEHMRMSFISDKFNEKNQLKIEIFTEIIVFLFAALVLVFGGFKISGLSMGQLSATLQIPMGYVYLALPLSGIITMIYNFINIIETIIKIINNNNAQSYENL